MLLFGDIKYILELFYNTKMIGGEVKNMTGIYYVFLFFIIVSFIMSIFRKQGRNYPGGNMGSKDQHMNTNDTIYTGAQDININGVPDYMEPDQVDRDHDGIPDYMDSNPGNFDGGSNTSDSFFDNYDFGSGNDFSTNDFDSGSSIDSGSFDMGGSDFGGSTVD